MKIYAKNQDIKKITCYNIITPRGEVHVTLPKFTLERRDPALKNFWIFVSAINYIEDNLCDTITQEDIAKNCFCSLSTLQKLWKYCTHTTIKEYISKRRLTKSAEELLAGKLSVTDIAFKYQYNSAEVFTRAFTKLWGVAPSKFKSEWKFSGIFPRIVPDENNVGGNYMGKKVDISQLYDELKSQAGCYVLCFDIVGLMPVNENIGRGAGDKVILEALKRLDSVAGDDMTIFRIGGDEFVIVTGKYDKDEAEEIANKVICKNGDTVEYEGQSIPVSMRVGATKYSDKGFRYSDLYEKFHYIINNTRDEGKLVYFED